MNSELIKTLKKPTYFFVALGSAFLFFDLSFYLMSRLPGEEHLACVIGAGLNIENIVFSVLVSILAGIMVSGLIALFNLKKTRIKVGSVSVLGVVLGFFTVFCTACTLPLITFFGIGISLSFFTTYNLLFKILSLVFILAGLYYLDRQLKHECIICKLKS